MSSGTLSQMSCWTFMRSTRRFVLKKPGSTMITCTPNGAISRRSESENA
jgi:hypothetical protein